MKVFGNKEIDAAAEYLRNGGVLAFPTETVYGLGCVYDNKEAFDRLVAIKRRPLDKPMALMFGDLNEVFKYIDGDLRTRLVLDRFLPGEVTFLLRGKKGLPYQTDYGTGIIGIRVPDNPRVKELINKVGKPCLVTSCNISGEPPFNHGKDVINRFMNEDMAVMEGNAEDGVPTTVVDMSRPGKITLVREGKVDFRTLENSFKKKIIIALGSDHAGYEYKEAIKKHLQDQGYEIKDCGTDSKESCDYPLFAFKAAKAVSASKADYGVLVCSSGIGISIAANKVKGIRCGLAYNDDVAHLMREHNRANMVAFGASFMSLEDVLRRTDIFLASHFERGRHQRRVGEIIDFENQ